MSVRRDQLDSVPPYPPLLIHYLVGAHHRWNSRLFLSTRRPSMIFSWFFVFLRLYKVSDGIGCVYRQTFNGCALFHLPIKNCSSLLLLLLLMMLGSTHPVGRGRWAPLFSRFFFPTVQKEKKQSYRSAIVHPRSCRCFLAAPTFWYIETKKIKKLLFFLFPLEWRKKEEKWEKKTTISFIFMITVMGFVIYVSQGRERERVHVAIFFLLLLLFGLFLWFIVRL